MLPVTEGRFIDRASALIDRPSRTLPAYARTPDIRMDGVRFELVRLNPPFSAAVHDPDASLFYFVLRGSCWLECPPDLPSPTRLATGTALAMERGRWHVWRSANRRPGSVPADEMPVIPFGTPPANGAVDLVRGRIQRRNAALLGGADEFVLFPPDAAPYRAIFEALAAVLDAELRTPQLDREAVERRVAEIIVIQLLRFELDRMKPESEHLPATALHDDRILRALTAAHHDPARAWTVKDLADVAGLSRTAFAERFAALLGDPPLHYLNRMRMQRAAASLRVGRRSLLEIAQSVGYRSEPAFIRAFQRHFGTSPGRWRRDSRSEA
jgi:AraC-like DNA-binding protein